jgi:hypothetical protein
MLRQNKLGHLIPAGSLRSSVMFESKNKALRGAPLESDIALKYQISLKNSFHGQNTLPYYFSCLSHISE